MKKTILTMMLATACIANAQKPFKLQGTVEGNPSKIYVLVGQDGNYGEYCELDSAVVKKGKFTLTRQLNGIVPARFSTTPSISDKATTVYFVPGETLKLTVKGSECSECLYDGTPIYKQCNEADKLFTPVMLDIQKYYEKVLEIFKATPEDKAPEVAERLGDSLNVRAEAFEKMVKDYVGTHRDNEGAMLLLSDVVSDIEQEYAQMSDAMKNSLVGKFYKERIDYANKLQQAREEEERKEQEKLDAMSGTPAYDFTLTDINGKPFTISSLRGKYVILDFWGSWCGWCIKGMPDMKEYYKKYSGKFEIVGIDCNDSDKAWRDAVAKHELPWIHVYNPRGGEVLDKYSVTGFPTKVVVSPDGNIAKIIVGEDPAFYTYLDSLFADK